MQGRRPLINMNKKGFSLIEIIIVITIMAIVIGIVGSLLAGYTRMFNETDDQAVARQRAQDVFNAIEVSVVNCALGIPTDSMNYFDLGADPAPISAWARPLEIKNTTAYGLADLLTGNVLRVVYSIPAHVKNNTDRVTVFAPPAAGTPTTVLTLTSPLSTDLVPAASSPPNDTRRFITFPNAYTSPLKVTSIAVGGNTVNVTGRPQPAVDPAINPGLAQLVRGEIAPYQDVQLVRAIAAYVDDNSVFHAAEVNNTDVSSVNPTATHNPAGMRVEGIKAIWFERTADHRLLTVRVLAEGDIVDQTRRDNTLTRNELKARWASVPTAAWDDRIFYADFEVTWRIRNYAPN